MARQAHGEDGALTKSPGFLCLAGAALGVAVHGWIAQGTLVPFRANDNVSYLFVPAPSATLVAIAVIAAGAFTGGHWLIRRTRNVPQPAFLSLEDVGYTRPLLCFWLTAIALLNVVPGFPSLLPVVTYFVVDLRVWWTLAIAAWFGYAVDARLDRAAARWVKGFVERRPAVAQIGLQAALAGIAIGWSALGTPMLRQGGAHGDEPKYLRYAENFYQGLGFDHSAIKPIADLPADFRPRVWRNFALLADVVPQELQNLGSDARRFARDPWRRFNRARFRDGGFLDGKDGGAYQVHNPGVSMMMFPAYYLDRQFATVVPPSPAQWPYRLPFVNAFFLALYGLWAVVVFRFLRRSGAATAVAWFSAAAVTLPLPMAAFPFQYYPELAAGLFISLVGAHLLFANPATRLPSACFGLVAGYLPWFHVRFVLVTAAFAVGAVVVWRRDIRRLAIFLISLTIPVALFCFYAYHITGSVLPSALWDVEGDANFSPNKIVLNAFAYFVDRDWGLLAHSPVLLLALPGYWWLARQRPAAAFLNAIVLLALLLPASGKILAQTTPTRLILAVVPFAATPIIAVLSRGKAWVWALFAVLLVMSLDNALAYNLHHEREVALLYDWSVSGWKSNLLFPYDSRAPWHVSTGNGVLTVCWLVALVALLAAPALMRAPSAHGHQEFRRSEWIPALAAVFLVCAIGSGVSAATGVWTTARYQMPASQAALAAAEGVDKSGAPRADTLLADLERIDPAVRWRPSAVARAYAEWTAMRRQVRDWYVAANGREPDNQTIVRLMYAWQDEHVAPDEIRRRIATSR